MRVALYVTCLVDLMRPAIGFAALRLIEACGCEVVVPPAQTCCGQPAWNAGNRPLAIELARKAIGELENYDAIVVPSGSCADQIRNVYPQLLADQPAWAERARRVAGNCRELTTFLHEMLRSTAEIPDFPGEFAGSATYHDSCKGLRALGVKEQPRELLARVRGLTLREMDECESCCGFGGAFSVRFADVSTRIVDDKCAAIARTGAEVVIGGDLGCLLNIEGRLRRLGDQTTRVLHIAEVLAGGDGS